jgi:hypothetical protein
VSTGTIIAIAVGAVVTLILIALVARGAPAINTHARALDPDVPVENAE